MFFKTLSAIVISYVAEKEQFVEVAKSSMLHVIINSDIALRCFYLYTKFHM